MSRRGECEADVFIPKNKYFVYFSHFEIPDICKLVLG